MPLLFSILLVDEWLYLLGGDRHEKNEVMISRILEAIWNQRNLADAEKHFAGDYLGHSIIEIHGPGSWKEWAAANFKGFTNSVLTIQDQIAEGDKVATRWTACSTHAGECEDYQLAGRMVTIVGKDISALPTARSLQVGRF